MNDSSNTTLKNYGLTELRFHNRWLAILNARLTLDRSATHSNTINKQFKPQIILDTWAKTLKNEPELLESWISMPRVFSGHHYFRASRL